MSRGKVALVDAEDYEWMRRYKWTFDGRYVFRRGGNGRKVYMHREVIGAIEGEIVDHINRNKLDNRASNLRIATYQQNSANSRTHSHNTSGYRGVYKWRNYWRAAITLDGKQVSGGYFKCKKEAAKAYNELAKEHFGDFASLNVIE